MKTRKIIIFSATKGNFFKTQWAWQDIKSTWLISIFTCKKVLVIFDKDSADKIQSKMDKEIKVPSYMPISVKVRLL